MHGRLLIAIKMGIPIIMCTFVIRGCAENVNKFITESSLCHHCGKELQNHFIETFSLI